MACRTLRTLRTLRLVRINSFDCDSQAGLPGLAAKGSSCLRRQCSGCALMRRGPKKVHPKLPDGKKTRAEALRIWEKVDIGKKGFVTVPEVLKQSKLLEQECPDFIRDYESVARDGRVTRTAFLGFCVGKSTAEECTREVDMVQLRKMFDEVAGLLTVNHGQGVSYPLLQSTLPRCLRYS